MAVSKRRMTAFAQALGKRIAALRVRAGLSQDALAAQLDSAKSVQSRLENGGALPSLTRLLEMADALRVEVREFFEFDAPPTPATDEADETAKMAKRIAALLRQVSPAYAEIILEMVELLVRRLRK